MGINIPRHRLFLCEIWSNMLIARMQPRWFQATIAALALFGSTAIPATASATTTDASFPGGSLTGLTVDAAFTQGSFQDLSYHFEDCGTKPAEETCTWELRLTLYSDPAHRCVPSTPESQLLWDSGQKSGNGSVDLGSFSFALEGCGGQILSAYYESNKTFNPEEEEGPWKVLVSGGSASLFSIGIGAESPEEAEQRVRAANPPTPVASPAAVLPLAVSANCHSLKIGSRRYAFVFGRMGCRKATNLATMAYVSGAAPSGYRCQGKRGGGRRCWRRGQPKKYFEWHVAKLTRLR